jgi:hypothetical protein
MASHNSNMPRTVAIPLSRIATRGGRLVIVDSFQRGDQPDYEGLLKLFPHNYYEPYYLSYTKEDFGALAASSGLKYIRSAEAFVSKVMVFDKPTVTLHCAAVAAKSVSK